MTTTRFMLGGATLWSAALVVAACTLPVYSGEESTGGADGGVVTHSTSATLVDVNGLWGAVLAGLPLVITGVVAILLAGRRHRVARVAAWLVVGALGLLVLAGLLSVGLFFMPVLVALAIAVASAPPVARPGREPRVHALEQ